MIKILGILDIITAIIMFTMPFKLGIPSSVIFVFAVYLLVKAVIFITNPMSWIDLAVAVILLLGYHSVFVLPRTAMFVLAFIILQKGLFSMLG
jgi:hypothetical protein